MSRHVDRCYYCGKEVPEGRMVCKLCEWKMSGVKPTCQWFHGNGLCLLKATDCTPLPCRWFEEDPRKVKGDNNG